MKKLYKKYCKKDHPELIKKVGDVEYCTLEHEHLYNKSNVGEDCGTVTYAKIGKDEIMPALICDDFFEGGKGGFKVETTEDFKKWLKHFVKTMRLK